jgi:hypothetical protein
MRARYSDSIFILSTSRTLNVELNIKFTGQPDTPIVRIEGDVFFARLAKALQKRSPTQARTLIRGDVSYYDFESEEPGENWALPPKLSTQKRLGEGFELEHEHRFLFATRRHAFEVNKVDPFLVGPDHKHLRRVLPDADHRVLIELGPLTDCCQMVSL